MQGTSIPQSVHQTHPWRTTRCHTYINHAILLEEDYFSLWCVWCCRSWTFGRCHWCVVESAERRGWSLWWYHSQLHERWRWWLCWWCSHCSPPPLSQSWSDYAEDYRKDKQLTTGNLMLHINLYLTISVCFALMTFKLALKTMAKRWKSSSTVKRTVTSAVLNGIRPLLSRASTYADMQGYVRSEP